MSRHRNYCWTLWAGDETMPLAEAQERLERITTLVEQITYVVWQQERGTSGRLHLQGYTEFRSAFSRRRAKALLGLGASLHLEPRQGTQAAAIAYCKKQDTRVDGPWERGRPKRAGLATDVSELIAGGATASEVLEAFPSQFIRYHSGITKAIALKEPKRDFLPKVYILYGRTGAGKSSWALNYCKTHDLSFYVATPPARKGDKFWCNGYEGQHVFWIDEFYCTISYPAMLRLLDRYPYMLETKGAMVQFRSRVIIITTNLNPTKWYQKIEDKAALKRRLTDPSCKIYEILSHESDQDGRPNVWNTRLVQDFDFEQQEAFQLQDAYGS